MSESADFYTSWLGCGAFGASGVRLRDQEPPIFNPLNDISGCQFWFDANNNLSVITDNLLNVTSWSNLGLAGGSFDLSGGIVLYGQTTINGLNVVSFDEDSFLSGSFAMNFQARSVFIVVNDKTHPSGSPSPWLTSDTSGGMELFGEHNGTNIYFLGKHPSPIPELAIETPTDFTGYPAQYAFINSTDLSDNWVGVNGTKYAFTYEAVASGYTTSSIVYFLGSYLGGTPVAATMDIAEIIIYDTALNEPDRINVTEYLRRKWALADPPPAPFVPTDISGLNVWLDANNLSTITLSGTDIVSWSNLGSVGTLFNAECNVASYVNGPGSTKMVEFPEATTLSNYSALNYLNRTAFAVFQNLSDYTTLSYPYGNIMTTSASSGRQLGLAYDSNVTTYYMEMCQQGQNCPAGGPTPTFSSTNMALAIWASDSTTTASNTAYYNGGSNININTDLGNLYNSNPIPYQIGSPNTGSPAFRVGEILEYDSVLSASNISNVANYLVTKWAISSFQTIV